METRANDAAFPTRQGHYHGMSLRDYFAAQAMMGIQARYDYSADYAAKAAYYLADAMLKVRDGG